MEHPLPVPHRLLSESPFESSAFASTDRPICICDPGQGDAAPAAPNLCAEQAARRVRRRSRATESYSAAVGLDTEYSEYEIPDRLTARSHHGPIASVVDDNEDGAPFLLAAPNSSTTSAGSMVDACAEVTGGRNRKVRR